MSIQLQINPRQSRIVYEILRLAVTDVNNEAEYRNYRLCIKKRLNISFHKQRADLLRMEKAGVDTQMAMASLATTDERIEQLKEEYQVRQHSIRHKQSAVLVYDVNNNCLFPGSRGRISPYYRTSAALRIIYKFTNQLNHGTLFFLFHFESTQLFCFSLIFCFCFIHKCRTKIFGRYPSRLVIGSGNCTQ